MFFYSDSDMTISHFLRHYYYPLPQTYAPNLPRHQYMMEPYRLVLTRKDYSSDHPHTSSVIITPEHSTYLRLDQGEVIAPYQNIPVIHSNEFLEILFILEGQMTIRADGLHITCLPRQGILLDCDADYSVISALDCLYLRVQLRLSVIEQLFRKTISTHYFENHSFIPFSGTSSSSLLPGIINQHPTPEDPYGLFFHYLTKQYAIDWANCRPVHVGSYSIFQGIHRIAMTHTGSFHRDALSHQLHYSAGYLNEICKQFSGYGLYDYFISRAIKRAAQSLRDPHAKICAIRKFLGFSKHSFFSNKFRDYYLMDPEQYRLLYAA